MTKHKYFIVPTNAPLYEESKPIIENMLTLLSEGWIIKSETPTEKAVHYILEKLPEPKCYHELTIMTTRHGEVYACKHCKLTEIEIKNGK